MPYAIVFSGYVMDDSKLFTLSKLIIYNINDNNDDINIVMSRGKLRITCEDK